MRGPLPESAMPPSRRSTSVNPRASERLTAADHDPKSADLSKGVHEADRAEPHQTTGAEREADWIPNGEGGKPTHVPEIQAFWRVLRGERRGKKDVPGTVRKMDRVSRLFSVA